MKTIKELEKEIEEKKFELKLKDKVDGKSTRFDMNIRILEKQVESLTEVVELIEEIFTEGWFNYFHTTYGTDNENTNEKMINDIDKKIVELKDLIEGK